MSASNDKRVRRRHVLYLSGFDPQGPGHYHALYADQAALQSKVSGDRITVGPRQRVGRNAAWDVRWQGADGGEAVDTRYEFLRWDDIVRQHWPRGQVRLLAVTIRTTARLLVNGSLWRILQTSWPAFLALSLPASLIAGVVFALLGLAGLAWSIGSHTTAWLGVAVVVGGIVPLRAWAKGAQAKVQMAWLMRSASVVLQQSRGQLPTLEERLDQFAKRLCELVVAPHVDEVLVVGHSSGAMLAVSVLARALGADRQLLQRPASVSLLTLGECIPLLSYQPEAAKFRQELGTLRAAHDLNWIDVTAPPDGCCFALIDPTDVCEDGVPTEARASGGGPKRVSPRFVRCFPPERYQAIRRDRYRCHFQYLMAVEVPGTYDYFALTAGPRRLADNFAHQPAVTRFTDFQCFGGPRR
ncbi:hypothetical protein [Ideonella sp.]|uniref:hypothetical protein n=1 Tax=Ideonella sp. TaxID=1929293 RepID=UPI002E354F1C|nr:hypothetical protein [Ideonella sp.]